MRHDSDAVGGFFEDLPVLAFILAGVLSVAGTACWTSELLSDGERSEAVGRSAALLIAGIVLELQGPGELPTVEAVRSANLSGPVGSLPGQLSCIISIWCVHPETERIVSLGGFERSPEIAHSERVLMNAVLDGGAVGILEVRVFVWEA